jgi:hypothetical protein
MLIGGGADYRASSPNASDLICSGPAGAFAMSLKPLDERLIEKSATRRSSAHQPVNGAG